MTAALRVLLAVSLLSWARARDGELNFVVIGDWGGQPEAPYTTDAEREVAEQMGKTAAAISSQFTVALGDNFYDTGVKDASDPRFQATFEVQHVASIHQVTHFNSLPFLCVYLCAERVHGCSSAVTLVCSVRKSRPLWQCFCRGCLHEVVPAMVHA